MRSSDTQPGPKARSVKSETAVKVARIPPTSRWSGTCATARSPCRGLIVSRFCRDPTLSRGKPLNPRSQGPLRDHTHHITNGPVPGLANDSAVVFVSCVLEYVSDPEAALQELKRIAGSSANLFVVFVEPWTLTAALYPGARWAGGPGEPLAGKVDMQPVTTVRKVATAGVLVGLLALAARRG